MLERLIGDEQGDTREVRLAKVELKHSLELIRAVRAAGGTWRKYCLVPPKQMLRLRSLMARGRARVKVRARVDTAPGRVAHVTERPQRNRLARARVLEPSKRRNEIPHQVLVVAGAV